MSLPALGQAWSHQGLCKVLAGPRHGPETHRLDSRGHFFASHLQPTVKPAVRSQPVLPWARAAEAELLGCTHPASLLRDCSAGPALGQPSIIS